MKKIFGNVDFGALIDRAVKFMIPLVVIPLLVALSNSINEVAQQLSEKHSN